MVRILRKVGKIWIQVCDGSAPGPALRALIVPVDQLNSHGAKCGHTIPVDSKDLAEAGVRVCKPNKFEAQIANHEFDDNLGAE